MNLVKVSTGDSDYPDNVRMVKRIKYAIGDRAEVGSGKEAYDLEAGVFELEGGLLVGAAINAYIADIGGAQTARGDREDMDADPIPPSSVSTIGSNWQVSSMQPRCATTSSSSDLIEIIIDSGRCRREEC